MTEPVDGGRFRSRSRTYGGALALVLGLLVAGVAVPVVFGDRTATDAVSELPSSTGTAALDPDSPVAGPVGPDGDPLAPTAPTGPDGTGGSAAGPAAGSDGSGPSGAATGPGGAPTSAGPVRNGGPAAPPAGGAGGNGGTTTGSPVTLGVVLTDIGALAASGFAGTEQYSLDKQRRAWEVYIASANAKGGAAGHKIVPKYATVEFGNAQASSQAACKQLTETDKAFAVVHLIGIYGAPILCFTRDHKTPYLTVDGAVSSFYRESGGYLFTVQPSTLRTHLNSVVKLIDTGELGDPAKGTGKKIGLLSEDGYLAADNDALQRLLEQKGFQVTRGTHSSSSSQNVPAQLSVASSNMCNAGVQAIFLNTNALFGAQFVNQVESRPGCRPSYLMSDFDYQMSGDSFLQQMPDGFYRRAIGVTSSRVGEGRAGAAEPAHDKACRAISEKATGERLDRSSTTSFTYFQAQWNCTLLQLFVRGMDAVGPTGPGPASRRRSVGSAASTTAASDRRRSPAGAPTPPHRCGGCRPSATARAGRRWTPSRPGPSEPVTSSFPC